MPAVMFSTFWVPPALVPGWYRWVSDHNPATPLIDLGRSFMLGGVDAGEIAVAAAVLAGLGGLTYTFAGWRLGRLLRNV